MLIAAAMWAKMDIVPSRNSALDSLLSWSDTIGILWAPDLSKQMPPQRILAEMDKAASSLTSDLRVLSGLGLTNLSAEKATDMLLEALIDEAKAVAIRTVHIAPLPTIDGDTDQPSGAAQSLAERREAVARVRAIRIEREQENQLQLESRRDALWRRLHNPQSVKPAASRAWDDVAQYRQQLAEREAHIAHRNALRAKALEDEKRHEAERRQAQLVAQARQRQQAEDKRQAQLADQQRRAREKAQRARAAEDAERQRAAEESQRRRYQAEEARRAEEERLAEERRQHILNRPAPAPEPQKFGVSHEGAEHLVMEWMRHLGALDAQVTQYSGDGGIDVVSEEYVVQVKNYAGSVPVQDFRALFGVAIAEGKKPLFFTSGTPTTEAFAFAARPSVAMPIIEYSATEGTIEGLNPLGRLVVEHGLAGLHE